MQRQCLPPLETTAASLNAILAARKLTQAEAACVLGVNQPKVSALKGYKLEGFSVERLMHFATALQLAGGRLKLGQSLLPVGWGPKRGHRLLCTGRGGKLRKPMSQKRDMGHPIS